MRWISRFSNSFSLVDRMVAATIDEFKKISKNGMPDYLFQDGKRRTAAIVENQIKLPYTWNSYLSDQVRQNRLSAEILNYPHEVEMITPSQIRDVVRHSVDLKNFSVFELR